MLCAALGVYGLGWIAHFALLNQPGPGYAFGVPSGDFLLDTLQVHRSMLGSNYGLTATHPDASPWWSWPLMLGPVFYASPPGGPLYFIGNPVLWWGTTLGLVAAALVGGLGRKGRGSPRPLLWVPVAGYLIAYAPLIPVPRPLFLYHYLTPLVFGVCAVVLWLDGAGLDAARRPAGPALELPPGPGRCSHSASRPRRPLPWSFIEAPAYQEWVLDRVPAWR